MKKLRQYIDTQSKIKVWAASPAEAWKEIRKRCKAENKSIPTIDKINLV